MTTKDLIPPLRLIINSECNGKCRYCHREGNNNFQIMSKEMILECMDIAEYLSLPNIALTGGEPTLRNDLAEIINSMNEKSVKTKVGLTTNGERLMEHGIKVKEPIWNLNLSMTSFDETIAKKYQNVNPYEALNSLKNFPAYNKKLNVLVVEENYIELKKIIEICIKESISIDLMFEWRNDLEYQNIQRYVLEELVKERGLSEIVLKSTPTMRFKLTDKTCLNLKHPFLSRLVHREVCDSCDVVSRCYERICAVRVHPNGMVTPCLSKKIKGTKESLFDNISILYNQFELDRMLAYDFLLRN